MTLLEDAKKIAEKITGWSQPSDDDLTGVIRKRKANTFRFKDDGTIPNHPRWPLILYRGAVRFPEKLDPAAVIEDLFESNGWDDSWRNGIYDYVHYHSRIHEVLGIARGHGKVQFGGPPGAHADTKSKRRCPSCPPVRAISAFQPAKISSLSRRLPGGPLGITIAGGHDRSH
jgi:hypothetical protein